ncbi:hypothetical protein AB0M39_31785 [Streptomyces sp. NPDC051907]|uniref:hypothetical protein n=1 Tax=Streptomyces sp. NPDC051907 TaxID=3155284 RepID=UPI00343748FC
MSDYYDVFLAVDLSPELSEPVLHEVRWLLGQAEIPPALESADWETWGCPWQVFAGGSASHAFAGSDTAALVRALDRSDPGGGAPWALTVRTCVHEDEFGVVMEVVEWLLRQATTVGWVGFVRSSASDDAHHVVRHHDGFELVEVQTAGRWGQVSWS